MAKLGVIETWYGPESPYPSLIAMGMQAVEAALNELVAHSEQDGDEDDVYEALYLALMHHRAMGRYSQAGELAVRMAPMRSTSPQLSCYVAEMLVDWSDDRATAMAHVEEGLRAARACDDAATRYIYEVKLRSLELAIEVESDPASDRARELQLVLFGLASGQRVFYEKRLLATMERIAGAGRL